MNPFRCILGLMIICLPFTGSAQEPVPDFRASLEKIIRQQDLRPGIRKQIINFYAKQGYRLCWLSPAGRERAGLLDSLLTDYGKIGWRPADYQAELLRKTAEGKAVAASRSDSITKDILLTQAFFRFYSQLRWGREQPGLGYDGWGAVGEDSTLADSVFSYITPGALRRLPASTWPRWPVYQRIADQLRFYDSQLSSPGFSDVQVKSRRVTTENKALCQRLTQLGFPLPPGKGLTDSLLTQQLKTFQQSMDLVPDAVLGPATLAALRVSLRSRFNSFSRSLAQYRWLAARQGREGEVLVVNIPAATLKAYAGSSVLLRMKTIVGKPSTRTARLSSRIDRIVLYPYWMVPASIAQKELLPRIRRNPAYLDAMSLQVIDRQGRVIDPGSIDWSSIDPAHFPYILRQSTGCDNSLGLLKFEFDSPYSIYLHDTPEKQLFQSRSRYFSHGCVRLENAPALARLLLGSNHLAVDTVEEKGCVRNPRPVYVPAERPMRLLLWYNRVDLDSTGNLVLYPDPYARRKP